MGLLQALPALDFGMVLDLASALVGILNTAVATRSPLLQASAHGRTAVGITVRLSGNVAVNFTVA